MDSDFTRLLAQMAEAIQEIRVATEGLGALSGALKSLKNSAASLVELGREVRQEQAEQTALLQALVQHLQSRPDLAAEESLYIWEKLLADFHSKPYTELSPKDKHDLFLRFQDFQRSHRKVRLRDVAGLEAKTRLETVIKDALDCYERLSRDEQDREKGPKEVVSDHRSRGETVAEALQSLRTPHEDKPKENCTTNSTPEAPSPHKNHHAFDEAAEGQGYLLDLFQKLKARFRDTPNVHVFLGMHSFTLRAYDPPRLEGIAWREIDEELDVPHYEAAISIEQAERLVDMHATE